MTTRAQPVLIFILTLGLVICVNSIGLTTPTNSQPFTITQIATSPSVNPLTYLPYEPTDTFLDTAEVIYLTLSFANAEPNSTLKIEWLNLTANEIIGDYAVQISGSQNAYFYITQPKKGWLTGPYQIRVYYNDQLVKNASFQIQSTQSEQPDNSQQTESSDVTLNTADEVDETSDLTVFQIISEYTLAKEVDPATYRPIKPTNRFTPDQPYLYLSISTVEAPANSLLRIEWSYIGQETFTFAEQELEIQDNDTAYFSLSKPDTGWPVGLYKVKIYLNGEFFDALLFRVVPKTLYDYIQSVGMTYEVIAETFTPVYITYLFFPSDPEIHLVLTFEDLPKETPFKVLWYYYDGGKRYQVAETPTTGSGDDTIDFWVESPEDGFWIGEYEAEVYIDGVLYTTVPFRVVKQ